MYVTTSKAKLSMMATSDKLDSHKHTSFKYIIIYELTMMLLLSSV